MTGSRLAVADIPRRSDFEELSRFERLMSELSARFINLPAAQIDAAIDDGLRRIGEALDIDRCSLSRVESDMGHFKTLHSWAVEGVQPVPTSNSSRTYPWVLATARAGKAIVFSRPEELPAEASVDRDSYRAIGLGSHVGHPVLVAGQLFGMLGFGSIRSERTWPDELIARMRLLAEIFGNALARKRAQDALDRAVGFERLASGVLASLLIARPGDEDRAIELGLQEIGLFLGVERASLWHRLSGGGEFHKTHGSFVEDLPASPARLGSANLPWISAQLLDGSIVLFSRLEDLAAEAASDLPALRKLGVRSLLAVPFSVAGAVAGALLLPNRHEDSASPEGVIGGVRLLAEVFASLHARQAVERRKQAAELEAANWRERLAHLVRVHTVGEMSAALAHEISQPLMAIENYALAARRRVAEESDPKKLADLLDKVVAQTARAGDVIKRLRGLVKRHDIEMKAIDVNRAVGECVEMVKGDCELRDIRLESKLAGQLPLVIADEIELQQVILNLLRNAIEAMEDRRPDVPRVIIIETSISVEEGVSVSVTDRGPGIAEGHLERVFEPFYSTKGSGLGIGLAICRRLIEAHDGTLRAFDDPGGGALFRFTLPVQPRE